MMKRNLSFFALLLLLGLASCSGNSSNEAASDAATEETATADDEAATDEEPEEDKTQRKSPPKTAEGTIGTATVTVNYGSPSMRGRAIFGELIQYNEIWRTGANEATTVSFSTDVMVEGQEVAAGTYALFTIPGAEKWTIILNKNTEQWGAYDYDESLDALRAEVTPQPLDEAVEALEFAVGADAVTLKWENTEVSFKVSTAS